jgi:hypothetical protein
VVSRFEAKKAPLYGVGGFMASLLVGLLLNIPLRAPEFIAAVPPLSGAIPAWFELLFLVMLVDAVLLTSLYAICFVAGIRHVPLFPRLLVAVWAVDMVMQLVVGEIMAARSDVPADVLVGLNALLESNLTKVIISAGIWAPYLLLSRRVNLTFRLRVPV